MPVEAAVMAVVDGCQIDSSAFEGKRPLTFIGGKPKTLTVGKVGTGPMQEGEAC